MKDTVFRPLRLFAPGTRIYKPGMQSAGRRSVTCVVGGPGLNRGVMVITPDHKAPGGLRCEELSGHVWAVAVTLKPRAHRVVPVRQLWLFPETWVAGIGVSAVGQQVRSA